MASADSHVDATDDFWAIDRDANIRFGLEAVRAGVHHIVLVATFEGRASRRVSEFSDAKECAVDAVGAACRQAGVTFTVIRPTAYFSDLTDRAFDTVLKKSRHTVIGDGSHRINPVAGDDVAAFLVDCIDDPAKAGREYPVGGPDVFSFREIGLLAAEVLGRSKSLRISSIPIWSLQLVAALAAAAFVSASAVALVLTAPAATAQPCSDVEVVFARGTGEPPGVGIVGQAFVDALSAQVGGR